MVKPMNIAKDKEKKRICCNAECNWVGQEGFLQGCTLKNEKGEGEMKSEKSSFMEQYNQLETSENFKKICDIRLENEKGKKLEENLPKFEEGLEIFTEWLGKTYGVHSEKTAR